MRDNSSDSKNEIHNEDNVFDDQLAGENTEQVAGTENSVSSLDQVNILEFTERTKPTEPLSVNGDISGSISADSSLSSNNNVSETSPLVNSSQEQTPSQSSSELQSSLQQLPPVQPLQFTGKDETVDNEDDFDINLDHMKSLVAKLDLEDDDDPIMPNQQPQASISTPTSHVSSPHQAPVSDPSILFAKKAEPGQTIAGLHDWIYRDPQGEVQGEFLFMFCFLVFLHIML